jgi:hypothetical protein
MPAAGGMMPAAVLIDPATGLPVAEAGAEEEVADAINVLPADFGGAITDSGSTLVGGGEIAGDGTTELAGDTVGDIGAEAALDFALPPGTFTVANLITGGALGEAVNEVPSAVGDAVTDIADAGTGAIEGAGDEVMNFFDSPNVFVNGVNSLGDALGDTIGSFTDLFDDIF